MFILLCISFQNIIEGWIKTSVDKRILIRCMTILPWVPEAFLARFPVSNLSYGPRKYYLNNHEMSGVFFSFFTRSLIILQFPRKSKKLTYSNIWNWQQHQITKCSLRFNTKISSLTRCSLLAFDAKSFNNPTHQRQTNKKLRLSRKYRD